MTQIIVSILNLCYIVNLELCKHSKNYIFGCVLYFLYICFRMLKPKQKEKKLNVLICIRPDVSKNIIFHMKIQEYIFTYVLGFNNLFIKIIKNLVFFITS